jgi:hypothetical protein
MTVVAVVEVPVERSERVGQLVHCEEAMATGEVSTPNGLHDCGVERLSKGWKERTLNRIHGAGNRVSVEKV